MKRMMSLMIVCTLLAGCADAIPDPTDVYDEEESIQKDWQTLTGEFTLVLENNSTLVSAPEMWLDTNKSVLNVFLIVFTVKSNTKLKSHSFIFS